MAHHTLQRSGTYLGQPVSVTLTYTTNSKNLIEGFNLNLYFTDRLHQPGPHLTGQLYGPFCVLFPELIGQLGLYHQAR